MKSISVVINTKNEETNIKNCILSVKNWANEIIVMDMDSKDKTVMIAQELGAKIFNHQDVGYVEPARNKALDLASEEWILLIDADETIDNELQLYLESVIETNSADFVRLPRANIIFGSVPMNGGWWPDYNVRFFRKGSVTWQDQIHSQPITKGEGIDAPASIEYAIQHNHYKTVSQFINRLDRYTSIQASELNLIDKFNWTDLISKPMNEFLRRYFSYNGWKDGTRGLALSILQAISEFVLYLKIWEMQKFVNQDIRLDDFDNLIKFEGKNYHSWLAKLFGEQKKITKKIIHSIIKRI